MGHPDSDTLRAVVDAAEGAFERGLQWSLRVEPRFLTPDSKMMVLAGLLLIDPPRVPEVRRAFGPAQENDPVDFLFAAVESDPLPVTWDEPDPFHPYTPDSLPQSADERLKMNGPMSHAALAQGSRGLLEEPVLSWMRQDLWGYDLNHQLLAWILTLKRGHRMDEARETILRFGARIWHELEHSEFPVYYDLFAESSVFLALAGFPLDRLAGKFREILSWQGEDGGWWFTHEPSQLPWLLDHCHEGASPLLHPRRHYSEEPDPERARQRLETAHRGHSTGLSLWGLGMLLQRHGAGRAGGA